MGVPQTAPVPTLSVSTPQCARRTTTAILVSVRQATVGSGAKPITMIAQHPPHVVRVGGVWMELITSLVSAEMDTVEFGELTVMFNISDPFLHIVYNDFDKNLAISCPA
jgi:hypothetical protein